MKKNYKILLITIYLAAFIAYNCSSQTAPNIEWQNTIGGGKEEELYSIKQTSDGGYILGGNSYSNASGDKTENSLGGWDYWMVKTDATGKIQLQNTIGGNDYEWLFSVQQTKDEGYILGGFSISTLSGDKTENGNGSFDYWIVKTDSTGNIQWQNTIGGNIDDRLYSLQQTADNGYILGGYSYSDSTGDKTEPKIGSNDYWILKTDSSGNIQWQNTIGGNENDMLFSIRQTVDGGYILGGYSLSNISGDKTDNSHGSWDYWIIKTDTSGNIQWQKTIGGSGDDELRFIQQTTDGGYIMGGYSSSNISGDKTESCIGGFDYWIVKTDASGNIQWQNTIGGSWDDIFLSIQQTSDDGYILGGFSYSNISGDKTENNWDITLVSPDYWIIKTDSLGNVQWQRTIGGDNNDYIYSVQQTSDNGYILGGYSQSDSSGNKTENTIGISGHRDYWIVKLAPDTITGIPDLPSSINNLQFFPNPLTIQSQLTFKNPNKEKFHFTLYDITGRITETISTITNEIILTKGSKQPGVYLFNLMNEKTGKSVNGKIVIAE